MCLFFAGFILQIRPFFFFLFCFVYFLFFWFFIFSVFFCFFCFLFCFVFLVEKGFDPFCVIVLKKKKEQEILLSCLICD
jgi:hypothetical protein